MAINVERFAKDWLEADTLKNRVDFYRGVELYRNFKPRPDVDKYGKAWLGWMIARAEDLHHIWQMHQMAGMNSSHPVCQNAVKKLDKMHKLKTVNYDPKSEPHKILRKVLANERMPFLPNF